MLIITNKLLAKPDCHSLCLLVVLYFYTKATPLQLMFLLSYNLWRCNLVIVLLKRINISIVLYINRIVYLSEKIN